MSNILGGLCKEKIGVCSIAMLHGWSSVKELYNTRMAKDDSTFNTDTPETILCNFCKYSCIQKGINLITFRSQLQCIISILKHCGVVLSDKAQDVCQEKCSSLLRKAIIMNNGISTKCFTAMTGWDMKHLINSTILDNNGDLHTPQLELIHKFVIGLLTGCRHGKIEYIAAASWKIKITRDKDGKIISHVLIFTYCQQKIKVLVDSKVHSWNQNHRILRSMEW